MQADATLKQLRPQSPSDGEWDRDACRAVSQQAIHVAAPLGSRDHISLTFVCNRQVYDPSWRVRSHHRTNRPAFWAVHFRTVRRRRDRRPGYRGQRGKHVGASPEYHLDQIGRVPAVSARLRMNSRKAGLTGEAAPCGGGISPSTMITLRAGSLVARSATNALAELWPTTTDSLVGAI
jgi:hypothetical protein